VDTNDAEINGVYHLWKNYLNSRPDSIYDNPYWSTSEKMKYKDFDLTRRFLYGYATYGGIKYNILKHYIPMVLSIEKRGAMYEIRTAYINHDTTEWAKPSNPWAIQKVYCEKENTVWKLFSALKINTKNWKSQKYGQLSYYYSEEYEFNSDNAYKTVEFIKNINSKYKLNNSREIEFYISQNSDELAEIIGFDYLLGISEGLAYSDNFQVFSGIGSELYHHEIVHLLFNEYSDTHSILSEGLATYLGGTGDISFGEALKNLSLYLKNNDSIYIDMIVNNAFINGSVEVYYTTGAVICKMLEDMGGPELILKVMSKTKSKDDLFLELERAFDVKRNNLNKKWRQKVFEYAE
jgi:hypothetical protein